MAAVALALSFQATTSGLKIVTHDAEYDIAAKTTQKAVYLCNGAFTALRFNEKGNVYVPSLRPDEPIYSRCPTDAGAAAIVTVDNPWIFKAALVVMALSSLLQIFLTKGD